MFQPSAIVLQCGADSLSGDRLGCFNLSLKVGAGFGVFLGGWGVYGGFEGVFGGLRVFLVILRVFLVDWGGFCGLERGCVFQPFSKFWGFHEWVVYWVGILGVVRLIGFCVCVRK